MKEGLPEGSLLKAEPAHSAFALGYENAFGHAHIYSMRAKK